MARVTRSKKIHIAEDHTAITIQTPLPDTPAKQPEALWEIHNTMGAANLAIDDNMVATELKGLKAAYRDALGAGKRGKKTKGRKKGKQESQADSEDTLDNQTTPEDSGESVVNHVPEATRQLLETREGSLASLLVKMTAPNLTQSLEDVSASQEQQTKPAAAARTTRRQMAIAQAGQYNSSYSNGTQDSSMAQKFRGLDFISLFGGRSTGSSRPHNGSVSGRAVGYGEHMTDYHSSLADALSKSLGEANVEVAAINPHPDGSIEGEDTADHYDTKSTSAIHTPGKSPVKTLEEVERACALAEAAGPVEDGGEDSFVNQITCRSPAKPVSRIEDSVEALDKLEEALEALDQVAMAERMLSPEELREKVPKGKVPRDFLTSKEKRKVEKEAEAKGVQKQNGAKGQPANPGYASMRVKPTAAKHTPIVKKATSMILKPPTVDSAEPNEERAKPQPPTKATVKRPTSLLPPKEPAKSAKPPTRPTFQLPGEVIAQKLKEQREARRAQRESSEDNFHTARVVSAPKVKSTKPPTKPTFVLPGEAVSQRKREAHEARLKAQEEEERKRREFKAKPVRNSMMPDFVPRDTVASLARRSKIGLEHVDVGDPTVSKRGSIIVGAHRPSLSQVILANTSAPRMKAPAPVRKPSPTVHGPSMSGRALQRSVSVTDVQVQRQRAKEIYNRDNKLAEDIEREKRERETAAKRAREEAAERGRQASREWAEKQLAKKMAAGDQGLSAGYGPGGQMGLKA
jgi:hypothetical protein